MSREERFREMGKHAFPDHRLLPKAMQEAIEKLPRNERQIRKKIIDRSLGIVYSHMNADHNSGAGYPIDQQLREYPLEYNERQLGHGLTTMPLSFNVFEAFYEFRANPRPLISL